MDTASFLARIVPAQGNHLSLTWKSPGFGWTQRAYKLSNPRDIEKAVNTVRWAVSVGADVYHAIASYNMATTHLSDKNKQYLRAERTQANVHLIKTLAIDLDVHRKGDGKRADTVFPDRRTALRWLLDFCDKTTLPKPNMAVNSGYGIHVYWLLEDALTLANWQPLANALKDATLAHGFTGDTAPTVDSARILRPPGTINFKAGADAGVPVEVIPALVAADYANDDIKAALTPWIGAQQQHTGTHGGATISAFGPRPSHIPPGPGAGLNQATHAGLESRFKFSEIAKKCAQVKTSLANHGEGDPYPLWYLGHLTLSVFTQDGKQFVHEISKGHEKYNAEDVDLRVAKIESERAAKDFGAPTCDKYNDTRPGICGTCPFRGTITSPIALGVEDDINQLPYGWRKIVAGGRPRVERKSKKDEGGDWIPLFEGEVSEPRLDVLPTGGHRLTFAYRLAGKDYAVAANEEQMTHQLPVGYFSKQGMAVTRHTIAFIGDFVMAWITQLRMQQAVRNDIIRPFGWNFDEKGNRMGLAIAGTLYKCDGTDIAVPGGDPKIIAMYRPTGDVDNWRKAAALFEGGRADLQAVIAASFGATLVSLCGDVRGMTMNFWSTESGIGKSTAIKIGQSVWGDARNMQSMRDTPNAVMRSLSEPRVLIRYWDELRIRKDYQDDFVEMVFTIPQGKERARMQADTTLREVGEWETMLVFTSNRACQDYLLARDDGTDSGLARILEIEMAKLDTPFDPSAGRFIKLCETNFGHVGRVYAKHLATHLDEVQTLLATVVKRLQGNLNMQQDERFSITAIACTVVGAMIAKQLNLFDFDVRGIAGVLTKALLTQREQRSRRTMVSSAGGFDLEELIGEFVYAQADYRIHTKHFATGGAGRTTVLERPRNNTIRLQIAEAESMLRIQRSAFIEWLRYTNRPASTIVTEMKEKLGAVEHRKSIGGGTGYGASQVWVLDVPLIGKLEDLKAGSDDEEVKTAGKKRRSPGNILAAD